MAGATSLETSNPSADPRITMLSVKDADPFGFYEELRARGPLTGQTAEVAQDVGKIINADSSYLLQVPE